MKRDVVKFVFNDIVCKYRFMCEIKINIRGYLNMDIFMI